MIRFVTTEGALFEADLTPEEELQMIRGEPIALRGRVRRFSPKDGLARLTAELDQVDAERAELAEQLDDGPQRWDGDDG